MFNFAVVCQHRLAKHLVTQAGTMWLTFNVKTDAESVRPRQYYETEVSGTEGIRDKGNPEDGRYLRQDMARAKSVP